MVARAYALACALLIGASALAVLPLLAPVTAQSSASISISPTSGPTNTVVTITGSGLTPDHTYQYCIVPGTAPSPPTPCPYGAYTFVATANGTVPTSPGITVGAVGYPEYYTVMISDPTGSLILVAEFLMTGGPTTTGTHSSTSTATSSSGSGGGVPEFPFQMTAVVLTALALTAAYLFARRRAPSLSRP